MFKEETLIKESPEENLWEKLNKKLMPEVLAGTDFKIPYEALPARQLVTRAEMAQETGSERHPYQYVGRKVNRKSFINPLSQREYVIIKSNRGDSPHLFFSFLGAAEGNPPEFDAGFDVKNLQIRQKSQFSDLVKEKREVWLSRIVTGSNLKGEEHKQYNYLNVGQKDPIIETVFREDAQPEFGEKSIDYVTHGIVVSKKDPSRLVSFIKVQSRDRNNETIFVAGEYQDGNLLRIISRTILLENLPIFEEILRENPESLLKVLEQAPAEEVPKELSLADGKVVLQLPQKLNERRVMEDLASGRPTRWAGGVKIQRQEDINLGSEILVDPEVDKDLHSILEKLKSSFGRSLVKVYFYGSIPRGYKQLQSDIDILAVVETRWDLLQSLNGFLKGPHGQEEKLIHDAIGSYLGPSSSYPFRNIELHTISKEDFEKPSSLKLGDFLRNASQDWALLYNREDKNKFGV
ncbi:MAG: nucleotidyltransferase domain-containing protein [Candidatus Harrisonbacteria bacterium]|nr:nucleotidyltransferase domain-containing protein [Candidatus Harrisonbacteria bacterium]